MDDFIINASIKVDRYSYRSSYGSFLAYLWVSTSGSSTMHGVVQTIWLTQVNQTAPRHYGLWCGRMVTDKVS